MSDDLATRVAFMKASSRIRDLEARIEAIEATDRRLIDENGRLRAEIAELHDWADTLLRKIEVFEAQNDPLRREA